VASPTNNGTIIQDKLAHITEECHSSLKRSQLLENDILFSIAGALGRITIVKKDILPANTNQALAILRLSNVNYSLPSYIGYCLKSQHIFDQINKFKAGVAQLNLSLEQMRELQIPLPPPFKQQGIVYQLDALSAETKKLKANYQKKLADMDEMKKSILQKAFSGELTEVQ